MNMQQAGDLAEKIREDTRAAIKPGVEARRGPSNDPICTDFKNDATGTDQAIRGRYVMTVISAERRGSFMGVVKRYWKKEGYEITTVRPNNEKPAIFARTPEGFQVTVKIGREGQAFFTVSSPCVTESGVTEPPREPIDPNSPGPRGCRTSSPHSGPRTPRCRRPSADGG
ncbi:hypothetical protein J7E88_33635 [Streptomyces sp. ISL-10]|uniref:hypothetical protein n=1 Tax=Streptomyces sp. ISL-10 TaxID=2819172 RepID=UPI001BE50E37|nr:hypothetical protein [Streptomyces sp. ISL-10]MBT2370080.1 hypothetical protein [Streptomyces sp. ISL-10]